MAHTKSTKKRMKTNEVRRQRNIARRSRVRHVVRDLRTAMAGADGPSEELTTNLLQVTSMLDRMTTKGLMHRNQVARLKSRLTAHMPS